MSQPQAGQRLQRLPNSSKYAPQQGQKAHSQARLSIYHVPRMVCTQTIVSNIDISLATIKAYAAFHERQNTANYRNSPVTDPSHPETALERKGSHSHQEDKIEA